MHRSKKIDSEKHASIDTLILPGNREFPTQTWEYSFVESSVTQVQTRDSLKAKSKTQMIELILELQGKLIDQGAIVKNILSNLESKEEQITGFQNQLRKHRMQIQKQIAQYEILWRKSTGGKLAGDTEEAKYLEISTACEMASKGSIKFLKTMLEYGADIHKPNCDGRTALHLAVVEGHLDCVKFLLQNGAQTTVVDRFGHTPMLEATMRSDQSPVYKEIISEMETSLKLQKSQSDELSSFKLRTVDEKFRNNSFIETEVVIDGKKKLCGFQGVLRGKCLVADCNCDAFEISKLKLLRDTSTGENIVSCTCGHPPAIHKDRGVDEETILDNLDMSLYDEIVPTFVKSDARQHGIYPQRLNMKIPPYAGPYQKIEKRMRRTYRKRVLVDATEVDFSQEIDLGAQSTVYQGRYKNKKIAIKLHELGSDQTSNGRNMKENKHKMENFVLEAELLTTLHHRNIVEILGVITTPRVCVLLEYCDKGSLYNVLNNSSIPISWGSVIFWMLQISNAVAYIHNHFIFHRDLKSKNILVDEKFNMKIADFGSAYLFKYDKKNDPELKRIRGTYAYAAPELCFELPFTKKSDIYSLGVIFWEMIYKSTEDEYSIPYSEYPFIQYDFQTILQAAKKNLRPTFRTEKCPPPISEILELLWTVNPRRRPNGKKLSSRLNDLKISFDNNPVVWNTYSEKQTEFQEISLPKWQFLEEIEELPKIITRERATTQSLDSLVPITPISITPIATKTATTTTKTSTTMGSTQWL